MNQQNPETIEQEFFTALKEANAETLNRLLADDFLLIDVMTGSEVTKSMLLDVIGGGALTFERIDRVEYRVRVYGGTAVVTGRTEMGGRFGGQPFGTSSRYTHVFVAEHGQWRMVVAQGTQIAPSPAAT